MVDLAAHIQLAGQLHEYQHGRVRARDGGTADYVQGGSDVDRVDDGDEGEERGLIHVSVCD